MIDLTPKPIWPTEVLTQTWLKAASIKELLKMFFELGEKGKGVIAGENYSLVTKELKIRMEEPDWKNPIPVVVPLVKVADKHDHLHGLLGIVRGIEPQKGKVAFPGGFQEEEDVKVCLRREFLEETGIDLVKKFGTEDLWEEEVIVKSTPDGRRNLMFYRCKYVLKHEEIDWNFKNEENDGMVIIDIGDKLAFPLHQDHIEWGLK